MPRSEISWSEKMRGETPRRSESCFIRPAWSRTTSEFAGEFIRKRREKGSASRCRRPWHNRALPRRIEDDTMHRPIGRWHKIAFTACLALMIAQLLGQAACADEVGQFYKGKTVRVLVGHSVG